MVLEKTFESPLDSKEIQPVHPKGNQSWTFIGRTNADAEASVLLPPNGKSPLIRKDPDEGKEESERAGLNLNILNTSWQIAGAKMKTVTDFTFLGSKITAENDRQQP